MNKVGERQFFYRNIEKDNVEIGGEKVAENKKKLRKNSSKNEIENKI